MRVFCFTLAWLVIAVHGCGELQDGQLDIQLKAGCQSWLSKTLDQAEAICLKVESASGSDLGSYCSSSLEGLRLEVDETAGPVFVQVEVLDGAQRVVARGRSIGLGLASGEDASVTVPIASVGSFSLVAGSEDACSGLPYEVVGHTTTTFASSHLLVIGSASRMASPQRVAMLIDTVNMEISLLDTPASLHRTGHTASPLADGQLLVAGGADSTSLQPLDTLVMLRGGQALNETFDANLNYSSALTFEQLDARLVHPRRWHEASVFFSSQVLINDGENSPEMFMLLTEDSGMVPNADDWVGSGNRAASVVASGESSGIVIGGLARRVGRIELTAGSRQVAFSSSEIGTLATRNLPVLLMLSDGLVMVLGGLIGPGSVVDNEVVLVDPIRLVKTDIWVPPAFPKRGYTANLLPDDSVLVIGGDAGEGTNPIRSTFRLIRQDAPGIWDVTAGPQLNMPRAFHTANLLPDGRLLIIGGTSGPDDQGAATSAEAIAW